MAQYKEKGKEDLGQASTDGCAQGARAWSVLKKHKPVSSALLRPAGGLVKGGGTTNYKNRAKHGGWTRLDSPSSLLMPGNHAPGKHDRGRKAAPAVAPTAGLVRADAGGPAGPQRGPRVVPRGHLERVRTRPPLPPFPSPSFLVREGFLQNSGLSLARCIKRVKKRAPNPLEA